MIRFSVIGGYLGTGKTTLLNHILTNNQGVRYALLINDFGEINIDAGLIASEADGQINLTNGCVCCTLADGFHDAIEALTRLEPEPDHIIVEASGVADVQNLAQYGYAPELLLDGVLVLADAETVMAKARDKYVATTVQRQLASADIIVLNKTDLVSASELQVVMDWITTTFAEARVVTARYGQVPTDLLFGLHTPGVQLNNEHLPHETYATWHYQSVKPIPPESLERFVTNLPASVLRAKGTVSLTNGHGRLVQVVGRRRETVPFEVMNPGVELVVIGLAAKLNPAELDSLAAVFTSG